MPIDRARVSLLAAVLLAGCRATGDAAAPVVVVPAATRETQPPPSRCPEFSLDEPEAPPPQLRAPERAISLSRIQRPAAPKGVPLRQRVDLGRREVVWMAPHPPVSMDISLLQLPRDVPRPDLPPPAQALWDRDYATRGELRAAFGRRARAGNKRDACGQAQCADLGCLDELVTRLDAQIVALRERRASERTELLQALAAGLAGSNMGIVSPRPIAGGLFLALASLLAEDVRSTGEPDAPNMPNTIDADPRVQAALTAYSQAAATTGEVAWFAGYGRATLLADMNPSRHEEAKRGFDALARSSGPSARTAEVFFRAASLEGDPAKAFETYRLATSASRAGDPVHFLAVYRALETALDVEQPEEAVRFGAIACEEASSGGGAADLDAIVTLLARALGRVLLPGVHVALPSVPASVFPKVMMELARQSIERLDLGLAEAAYAALRAETPEAGRVAVPPLPRTPPRPATKAEVALELATRASALALDCVRTHGAGFGALEVDIKVDASSPRAAKVTARAPRSDAPPGLLACFAARGPSHFVGVDAEVTEKLTLRSAP